MICLGTSVEVGSILGPVIVQNSVDQIFGQLPLRILNANLHMKCVPRKTAQFTLIEFEVL
jgi:hypothetical protein